MTSSKILQTATLLLVVASASAATAGSGDLWTRRLFRRQAPVDLHNGEFCVDVSTYTDIQYDAVPRQKCDTTFEKVCEDKSEKVCDEVTEIECDIVPYTKCNMVMENTPYRSFKSVEKVYKKILCTEGMDTVQHTKMMPECKNITKQNCITKWETDENGKQVWAGNEACEPVSWRECKLVPRQIDFKVPKIECSEAEDVPYTDTEDAEKTQMTTNMICTVEHTNSCKPVASTKCKDITYQECRELPNEVCSSVNTQVPKQEKEHKKKCLLPDGGNIGSVAKDQPVAQASKPVATYALPRGGRQSSSSQFTHGQGKVLSQRTSHQTQGQHFQAAQPSRQDRTFGTRASNQVFVRHSPQQISHNSAAAAAAAATTSSVPVNRFKGSFVPTQG